MVLASLAACLRVDVDEGDHDFYRAIPLSEPESVVTAAMDVSASDDGDRYGVIWQEYQQGGQVVKFVEVSASGELVDEARDLAIDRSLTTVWLFPTARGYHAFYTSEGKLYATEIPLDAPSAPEIEIGTYPASAVVVDTGAEFAIFYDSMRVLWLQRLAASGALYGDPATVFPPNADPAMDVSEWPDVVYTATGFHLVWNDYWGGEIGYAHLDADGVPIISRSFDYGGHGSIQIASDGEDGLIVTWYDGDRLGSIAVSDDGTPIWPTPRYAVVGNRNQSFEYQANGGYGSVGVVWRSDAETLLPQIMLSSYRLGDSATDEARSLTLPDYGFSVPRVERGAGGIAVAFRGEVEGSQRLYLEITEE